MGLQPGGLGIYAMIYLIKIGWYIIIFHDIMIYTMIYLVYWDIIIYFVYHEVWPQGHERI